jgi:hypothetical protein
MVLKAENILNLCPKIINLKEEIMLRSFKTKYSIQIEFKINKMSAKSSNPNRTIQPKIVLS